MLFLSGNNNCKAYLLWCLLLISSGCATSPFEQETINPEQHAWMQSIIHYHSNPINLSNNTNTETAFMISDDMRSLVKQQFAHQHKGIAIENLAHWLMSPEGHNMKYDLDANLTPIEAYEQKRGNCLSFTILLISLAKALDIKLDYNHVYLPNFWEMENNQSNFVLFRHVNAVRKSLSRTQIFDLAIEEYNFGFPQKVITEQQALAWLYSNLSIDKLNNNNFESALHHIKLSIAWFPKQSDFWVNLGVIYKKSGDLLNAERSFLHALNLSDTDSLAASNLEKLYRHNNQLIKADYFKKKAFYAQQKNPYIHYKQANDYLKLRRFNLARKSISKAKKLHSLDPRFYVLSSQIEQHSNNYVSAIKDIQTAYTLTVNKKEREAYSQKAKLLVIKGSNAVQKKQINFDDVFKPSSG